VRQFSDEEASEPQAHIMRSRIANAGIKIKIPHHPTVTRQAVKDRDAKLPIPHARSLAERCGKSPISR
jgi:hypothetical protein